MCERINKAKKSLEDYKAKNSIKNRKSKFVSCTKCGSKINKDYISSTSYAWNECPLCAEDLSSNTVKTAINSKKQAINDMTKDLNSKQRANNKKGKKSTKWLVKIEYHI